MSETKVLQIEVDNPGGANAAQAQPGHRVVGAERLMRLLSARNLQLLRLIKTKKPKSLSDLARISGRPKASLTRTIGRLSSLGIVGLTSTRGRGKTPRLLCDRLQVDFPLSFEDGAAGLSLSGEPSSDENLSKTVADDPPYSVGSLRRA